MHDVAVSLVYLAVGKLAKDTALLSSAFEGALGDGGKEDRSSGDRSSGQLVCYDPRGKTPGALTSPDWSAPCNTVTAARTPFPGPGKYFVDRSHYTARPSGNQQRLRKTATGGGGSKRASE